jgi:heme exporter protein C
MVNDVTVRKGLAPWKWLLLPMMTAVILMAYLWVGDAQGFASPRSARIIFWHVPMAMLSVVWFFAAAFYSVRYLVRHDEFDDTRAAKAAEVGLLLTTLATVTGAIFSKMQWAGGLNRPWYEGYWQWDPKQTAIVIAILIFAAYFALRMSVDDPNTRARLSAVYCVLAAAAIPFLYWVLPNLPAMGASMHPGRVVLSNTGLDPQYKATYWLATLSFLGISLWVYQLQLRVEQVAARRLGVREAAAEEPRLEAVRKTAVEQPVAER